MATRRVHLHGALKKFGGPYDFDASSVREIGSALCQIKGLRNEIMRGQYEVVAMGKSIRLEIDNGLVLLNLGSRITDVHITPIVGGAKSGGIGKAVIGTVLLIGAVLLAPATGGGSIIAATEAGGAVTAAKTGGIAAEAFALGNISVSFGQIAFFGATTALSGIAQLLAPTPTVTSSAARELADQRPSFLFNGAVNVSEQGHPVPIVYGKMRVGSVVISAGLQVEQLDASA